MSRLLVLVLLLAGCRQPIEALLVCHNSNCVEPPDPQNDDTRAALRESLALRHDDGRPVVDGVEIDLFWRGADGACLFAHDLDGDTERRPALEAAQEIVDHLDDNGGATRSGGPFLVFVELKGHVGVAKSDAHTPAQRDEHAACAAAVVDAIAGPAQVAGVDVRIVVTSFVPELLAAAAAQPAIGGRDEGGFVDVQLGALQGIPPPLDSATQPFERFLQSGVDLDVLSAHPQWLRGAARHAAASAELDLALWMFSSVPETLDAIEQWRPTYVVTSEARALDAFLSGD